MITEMAKFPEHLIPASTGYVSYDPLQTCPQCFGDLQDLKAPIVVQSGREGFSTHSNQARNCRSCSVVVLDGHRFDVEEASEVVGMMVAGRGDSTIYPFEEVHFLRQAS